MDLITKCIIVIIVIYIIYSYITYNPPLYKFTLQKGNIKPGSIQLPLMNIDTSTSNSNDKKELFLEIQPTPKYGDDYIHIKMTPMNFLNQMKFIVLSYKDNLRKGNIGYVLRLFSPVFNINLLYDQQMYFYLKDAFDNVIKPTFVQIYNNGKEIILEVSGKMSKV